MSDQGFKHEAEPIAGEGFVFVVNRDNLVDTLTIDQIKGIYSGKITNWKEVGGNDAEIIAYQRNTDSGSQNYMISFMGDTPLMAPVTDQIPASMSGILDVIANYDNGIDAIGYSVYAYSDGMYENISAIKYIKVNGVAPSLDTLADGSYPLLGYNYAVFSADEPKNSPVRTLVSWIQSDEGQQVIANAGYIPYRSVDGLTLPEPTTKKLYLATATSKIPKPSTTVDFKYQYNRVPDSFTTMGLDEAIQSFIAQATEELSSITEDELRAFIGSRSDYFESDLVTRKTLCNGYLSVLVGLRYNFGAQNSPDYYYDVCTAVFDIYTGARLELSDLFFEGINFVPLLNTCLANQAEAPYFGFVQRHDMLHDFTGLYEGEFEFTADSIIFHPDTCFADGVVLSLDALSEYMVTSIPRDMSGLADANLPVYMKIGSRYNNQIGYAEEMNGITIWYLDREKAPLSEAVCDKINHFIDETYDTYFTPEKLTAIAEKNDIRIDRELMVGPFPGFDIELIGNRFTTFSGANLGLIGNQYFTVIEGQSSPYSFHYYFHAETGEELKLHDLFDDGWTEAASYVVYDESFNEWDEHTWIQYTKDFDPNCASILFISDYLSASYSTGELSDLEIPVKVYIRTDDGDNVCVSIPRSYIRH